MADVNEDEVSEGPSDNEYEECDVSKDDHEDEMAEGLKLEDVDPHGTPQVKKAKLDPKDPLRPRRKKARRACFACQRAHLTCGDERPCQRCVKRGLAEACQDGVRKKAKYLHDAPPEALRPVLGPNYSPSGHGRANGSLIANPSTSGTSPDTDVFIQATATQAYPLQYSMIRNTEMPPPPDAISFAQQQSPISSSFQTTNSSQRSISSHSLAPLNNSSSLEMQNQASFGGPLFDPSNPALFNFDLEGLNFGNHYGALEFGMLNHMSSGAVGTPPHDGGALSTGNDPVFNGGGVFGRSTGQYGIYASQDSMLTDYPGLDRSNNSTGIYDIQRGHVLPKAYAIETGHNGASPSTDAQNSPQSYGFEASPTTSGSFNQVSSLPQPQQYRPHRRQDTKPTSKLSSQALSNAAVRSRDPSAIYTAVTEPYPYTTGFHRLTAFIQRRFSAGATLKIAKALASIRPSFISCTKTLNGPDLIFMEKCFQRTLFEYEDFMRDWGTPTLVCRRTGEVAAVNKEFTLLTGWNKNVLMGKEPNLNINTGKASTTVSTGASNPSGGGRDGLNTPRMRRLSIEKQDGKPHSVFLAELLDDDSVIEFYEDFAKLAFGDSRGSVFKRCKLLKYQTKEPVESPGKPRSDAQDGNWRKEAGSGTMLGGRVSKIDGEFGIERLQRDGKMDCAYCWTVKRDVFDIPMLIVMNFLPCI